MLEMLEKVGTEMRIRLTNHWTSWIWDQYLPENMNGNLVVWDKYLPENMKWSFRNLGSFKSPDGECLKKQKDWGAPIMNIIVGGSKTIGVNDRFAQTNEDRMVES